MTGALEYMSLEEVEALERRSRFRVADEGYVPPGEPASTRPRRQNEPPRVGSAADLRGKNFPRLKYIVPNVIAEGCTLLAGRPKLGKSWLMLDVGLAVAGGRYCLGIDAPCDPGDVLYLALEDNERRLQRRIAKVLGSTYGHRAPVGSEWPVSFRYATEWPRSNEGGLDAIRQWIETAANSRLVVIDVLAMFKPVRGDKESLYEADYNAIKGLQALAGEFGIAIVIVHHTRKSGAEHDPFEKVSGTLGLSGAADTALVLDRDGNGATLYGRGRDVEEIESAVTFDRETCRWKIIGDAAEVRRTDERSVILALLKDAEEPMSPAEIADAIGVPRNNVKQLLFKMAKAGEVEKAGGKGRYIHPDRGDLAGASTPHNRNNPITDTGGTAGETERSPVIDPQAITDSPSDTQSSKARAALGNQPVSPDPVIAVIGVTGVSDASGEVTL